MAEKYEVTILWGDDPPEDAEPITYEFATEAELHAFIKGADEAIGWHDYTAIGSSVSLSEAQEAEDAAALQIVITKLNS
jgi:hypothetical protein